MKVEWEIDDIDASVPSNRDLRLDATRHVESRGNPKAVSPAGAQGAYQFMPETAKQYGIADPFDEAQARQGASKYMDNLEREFGADLAPLAYNWGEGNVRAFLKTGRGAKGQPMPEEAMQYVSKINAAEKELSAKQSASQPTAEWGDDDIASAEPTPAPAPTQLPQSFAALSGQANEKARNAERNQRDAARAAQKQVTDEMSFGEQMLAGAGKSAADVGRALGLMEEGDKDIDEALLETGGGLTGNIAGDIGATLVPGGAAFKAITLPRMFNKTGSLLNKALRYGVGGAAAGAAGEATLNRDPLTGALYGGLFTPALMLGGTGVNAASKALQRAFSDDAGLATEELQNVLGSRAAQAARDLRATQPIVPGEQVTAGLAASPQIPELAVYEAMARRSPQANLFTSADEATANARTKVLNDVSAAGERPIDPLSGRLGNSPAMSTRETTTKPLYETAARDYVPLSQDVNVMMFSPEVKAATDAGIRQYRQSIANARASGSPVPPLPQMRPDGTYSRMPVGQMQAIVKHIDERLKLDPRNFELQDARKQLMGAMRDSSDDFATAQDLYRTLSAPQNRADVAKTLTNTLNSASDQTQQRAEAFSKALRDAPSLFNRSDLSQRFDTLEHVFAPNALEGGLGVQQLGKIRDVERSLNRQAQVENLPRQMGIVPERVNDMDALAQNIPHVMQQKVAIARSLARNAGRASDEKVMERIYKAAADPEDFAKLLEATSPTQRNALLNALRKIPDYRPGLMSAPTTTVIQEAQE